MKKMKINENVVIFLDIDGVVNVCAGKTENLTFFRTAKHMEEHLLARLDYLIEKLDAYVIVSSSWRLDIDDLQTQMENSGFKHWNRVKGRTALNIVNYKINSFEKSRGELIADIITERNINKYIVLDDYVDNILSCQDIDKSSVFKTDPTTGITQKDIENILENA